MDIVGIVGFANSGKGTVGNFLTEKYNFIVESFAAPVKDCCASVFGWPRYLLEGDTKESRIFREAPDKFWSEKLGYEVTPRLMMQKMGTEAVRQGIDDRIWFLSLEKRIMSSEKDRFVITDVRFPNEIEFIKSIGGKIIWVRQTELNPWYKTAYEDNIHNRDKYGKTHSYKADNMSALFPDVHLSEWAWIGYVEQEYVIYNDGTLKDLEKEVDKFTETL